MQKVIFLDRDGVINKNPPKGDYVKNLDELEILPRSIEGMRLLSDNGFVIFIVTNQPGIGRGLMTERDLNLIHKKLLEILKKNKIRIKDIYYCPHKRDDGCDCRKPKPGMLHRAAREYNFDVTKALFIGDDERDMLAGAAAGCKTVLIEPDGNLLQALQLLIK